MTVFIMKLFLIFGILITSVIGATLLCVLAAPANAATDTEIKQAIQDSLAWRSDQQHA